MLRFRQKAIWIRAIPCALAFGLLVQVHTAQAADLKDVYALASQYDADIAAANADHQAAIQRLPIAKSAFKPQLSAAFNSSVNDVNSDLDESYEDNRFTLSLTQSLFNRPNKAILNQARAGVSQADALLAAEKQSLILRATGSYFDVLRAQVELRFSLSELRAIARTREQAERRFEVGLVPVTDVREAQAQYDLAFAQKIAAENNLASAHEALFLITGDADIKLNTLAADLPLNAPDPIEIEDWVKLALENNPDLMVARMASKTAKFGVDAERGARYPTLDLVGLASRSDTHQQGRRDLNTGEVRLEFRMPVYTGGRVKALINQATAESSSAATGLIAEERRAAQRTRDAYRGVVTSMSRVKALRQALSSTRKAAQATDAGFRAGTRTSVEVLRSLRDTFRAQSDYSGARYDYIINALNLRAAAGTLTEADLEPINNFLVEAK
ncbi:MAG: TolC family outer membrane protein [Granulosicoccaceae bacterium]